MEYKIKSRIWLESEDNVFLGQGRVHLLRTIQETGSLSKAALQLNMSYKKAWTLLDSTNKSAKQPITVASTGGKGGGGVALTPYGVKMVEAFENLNQRCWDFLDGELRNMKI